MRILLATLSALIIAAAGPAHGDPGTDDPSSRDDASFLAALQAARITYSQADQAISAARAVCQLTDDGKSGPEVITTLKKHNDDLTEEHAAQFMAIALESYCPQNLPRGTETSNNS